MNLKNILETLPERYKKIQSFKVLHGGSERVFFRIKGRRNFIIIKDNPQSPDFISYLKIQRFLKNKGLGVPEIYYVDKKMGILIVEDLGDISLEKNPSERNYMKVIDFLVEMQVKGLRGFSNLKLPYKKVFDRSKLLYETRYFKNFYIDKYRRLNTNRNSFKRAFNFLADNISKLSYVFMHRDFQSKNIFIKNGKIRITDFQTAHKGPFTYDVASLLFDPYVDLKEKIREKLVRYYYRKVENRIKMNFENFNLYFKLTGIQRLLQALAAFVKLSKFKEKKGFESYIPIAERKVKNLLEELNFKELILLKQIF